MRRFTAFLFIAVFSFVPFYSLFVYSRSSGPLDALSVPKVSRLYLPSPLEFPSLSTSILGAQVIDPADIVKYVNIEREKTGAKPLRITPTLSQAAKRRAEVILKYQNFSHQDPFENIELGTVLPQSGYHYSWASENIGMGGVSGEDFVSGFMHSYYHKINLLDPKLVDTGVAVVSGPYKQYYVNIAVQLFAVPAGEDEYRGYTRTQAEQYRKYLASVEAKLNPFGRYLNKLAGNPDYSEVQYAAFRRQKEILETVYGKMKNNLPLDNVDVVLVSEYNSLLP